MDCSKKIEPSLAYLLKKIAKSQDLVLQLKVEHISPPYTMEILNGYSFLFRGQIE
jgi:hypothetical protein